MPRSPTSPTGCGSRWKRWKAAHHLLVILQIHWSTAAQNQDFHHLPLTLQKLEVAVALALGQDQDFPHLYLQKVEVALALAVDQDQDQDFLHLYLQKVPLAVPMETASVDWPKDEPELLEELRRK